MSVQSPRREPFAVPPGGQPPTRAGTTLHAQVNTPAHVHHAKANCGFCGEAWFGDVAYCPYCGRPSASAPVATASDALPEADSERVDGSPHALAGDVRSSAGAVRAGTMRPFGAAAGAGAEQPGIGWRPWAKAIAVATVFAAFLFAVGELNRTATDRPGSRGAMGAPGGDTARSGTPEPSAGAAAPTPAVPRPDIEPPAQQAAPVPPARNRSLCSAANEAAGLCNPQ